MSHWQAKTLREEWEARGMRVTELAAKAGISTNTLYRMNRKDARIHGATITHVCDALGITPEYYHREIKAALRAPTTEKMRKIT